MDNYLSTFNPFDTSKYNVNKERRHQSQNEILGPCVGVLHLCCNTGTGTAGKAVPRGALNSHFEASGSGSGYGK